MKNKYESIVGIIIGVLILVIVSSRLEIVNLKSELITNYKLEECPLCEGNASLKPVNDSYYIECDSCGLETRFYKSKEKLINYWNRE